MKSPKSGLISISLFKAILACGFIALTSAAYAEDAKFKVGTLICKGKGGIGLIIGSKETLRCSFSPAGDGPEQIYSATIKKIGLDIGVKGKSTIIWTVFGATTALPTAALAGKFVGVSAEAALGIGGGGNVLIGGNKKSIVLQPLSVKGQTGLNIAIGLSSLKLKHIQ